MVLYLIHHGFLTLPTLYLSGYINRHRNEYYRLLAQVSAAGEWLPFILFMLAGFHQQARETKQTLVESMALLQQYKEAVRQSKRKIPFELVDIVFSRPVLTPSQVGKQLGVHYTTATKHLTQLVELGLLEDSFVGKYHFYTNRQLLALLSTQ